LVFFQVWDVSIIETAMKDFYDNDQNTMIDAIQQNITVSYLPTYLARHLRWARHFSLILP
jgi:hypothetical protein